MIDIEPAQSGNENSTTEGEFWAHLPLHKRLLQINFLRPKLVFDLRVEDDVLCFCKHGSYAQHEARVLEGWRPAAVGALAERSFAELKVAIAANGDAIGAKKIACAGEVPALRFGGDSNFGIIR